MSDDNTDRPIRMISFAGEGVFSPVLDSQVVVPLRLMGKAAPQVQRALLVLTSSRHRSRPDLEAREQAIRESLPGARVLLEYRPPGSIPFEPKIWARRLRKAIAECGYEGPRPIVVHCRGQATATAAAMLKKRDPRLRILLDLRGAQTDELIGRSLWRRYLRWRSERHVRWALAGADALNTVSNKLAEHLRQMGLLTRAMPHLVIGCCVDMERFYFEPTARAERRRELGLENRFVVCYCGTMSHWQRPDAVAEAFAAVSGAMPDAHMLIVSREADPLLMHLRRLGVPEDAVTVRAAPHDQVASFLMAADVGLLLREDTLTNRVASPVKFAEYLRCGLPVIVTHYVGDFADFVSREGVGEAVSFPVRQDEIGAAATRLRARLKEEGDDFRHRCSRSAGHGLSWDGHMKRLVHTYEGLVRDVDPSEEGGSSK